MTRALSAPELRHAFPGLTTEGGGFAMLALDQRESLREMFSAAWNRPIDDGTLIDFKEAGVRILSPYASAVLLDRESGLPHGRPAALSEGTGLILAADVLHMVPGDGVVDTALDRSITPEYVREVRADALKLLVIWRPGSGADQRAALVQEFIELAEASGVPSLVEGIVRPETSWATAEERDDAIIAAAEELTAPRPDIYKAQVPGYRQGDVSRVLAQSRRLSEVTDIPWVVLSNGVAKEDFADAVREACRGGASGFLAGRAIWADVVGSPQPEEALSSVSTLRLERLSALVAGELA